MSAVAALAVTQAAGDAALSLNGNFVMLISAVPNISQPVHMVVVILGAIKIFVISTPIPNVRLRIRVMVLFIFNQGYVLIQVVVREAIIKSAVLILIMELFAPKTVQVLIQVVLVHPAVVIQGPMLQPVLCSVPVPG